jgi:hypothetical protein
MSAAGPIASFLLCRLARSEEGGKVARRCLPLYKFKNRACVPVLQLLVVVQVECLAVLET